MNAATEMTTIKRVKGKTEWIISSSAPKTVDELTFTSRDEEGRINWWDVTPPKTDYWPVHEYLGRAYALETLDLLHNPDAEGALEHVLRCILEAIARDNRAGTATGIMSGFYAVISEFVSTGNVSR